MEPEKIGMFIAKLRKEKKLTQKQLGKILNISDKTISKWERGTYSPDITMIKNLSQVLEVSVYELLNGKKSNEKVKSTEILKKIFIYARLLKIKYLKKILWIIAILITAIFTIYKTNEKYEWHVQKFRGINTELFDIHGLILFNKEESEYLFMGLEYLGNDIGTSDEPLVTQLEVSLYLDNIMLCKKVNQMDVPVAIHIATQKIVLILEKSKIVYNNTKKVSVYIKYKDKENNTYNTILFLN